MARNTRSSADTEKMEIGENPEERAAPGTDDERRPPTEDELELQENAELSEDAYHLKHGLDDALPSVRARFREHAGSIERSVSREKLYEGPFQVNHGFRFISDDGKELHVTHLMPAPGGAWAPRVIEKGDIPAKLAQELWADGVLKPAEPPAPKPRIRPRNIPMPNVPFAK